jgi:4-amino-4-deoxy-L-arabinose transferase-like glycosyltransferase
MSLLDNLHRWAVKLDRDASLVFAVVSTGVIFRIVYWLTYPPKWKLFAVFTPIYQVSPIRYMSDFTGYATTRLPFFDVLSAVFYLPMGPILGVRALSVFNMSITILSIPVFYLAISRLFNRRIGSSATILYSLYPKFVQLTATGFPEAASVAAISFSLFILSKVLDDRNSSLVWYGALGFTVLLSWLLYIPAVLFGIVLSLYLLVIDTEGVYRIRYWLVVIPSGTVGILYLIFGPIRQILTETTSQYLGDPALFGNPEAYGLVGKIVRYVMYTYFDFWWHRSGFDGESSILPLIHGLEAFLGPLFDIYFLGFVTITLILSSLIVLGFYSSTRHSKRYPNQLMWFATSVIIIYSIVWNLKNVGWLGTFQTRHVFPIFPIISLMFGVGLVRANSILRRRVARLRRYQPSLTGFVAKSIVVFLLLILLVNGAAQGVIRGEKYEVGRQEPVTALNGFVEDNETVAVVQNRLYRSTVLYSEGRIRPILLLESDREREKFKRFSPYGRTRVTDLSSPDLADIDYIYLKSECSALSGRPKQMFDYLTNDGAEIVYENHRQRPGFRCSKINVYVVRVYPEVSTAGTA